MIEFILHSSIRRFERLLGYDASYMHEIVDASRSAGLKYLLSQFVAQHRDGVSKDARYSAKLAAALSEDCGPCTQLCVNLALRDGVDAQKLAALLRGDLNAAGDEAAFGYRYGMAVSTNSAAALELVEEAAKRYGNRGKVSLALVVATGRVYPALKRGLGHGAACIKVEIASQSIVVQRVE